MRKDTILFQDSNPFSQWKPSRFWTTKIYVLLTAKMKRIGIWEEMYNPDFNYGEFATIKNQAGLNRFIKIITVPGTSIGLWEQFDNPNFKPVEFDVFRKEAGLNIVIDKFMLSLHRILTL